MKGWGEFLLNGQNPLSVTKVICRQSLSYFEKFTFEKKVEIFLMSSKTISLYCWEFGGGGKQTREEPGRMSGIQFPPLA